MAASTLNQHIDVTPDVLGGKPRITGRRISVQNIVIWHERMGMSADDIATNYDLSMADVYAALAYYFDNQTEIDQNIDLETALAEELRELTPSKLTRKQ